MDLERLSQENRGLLLRIAAGYREVCHLDRATDLEDLIQAGQFGLWAAAKTYNPEGGKSWTGWATYYIKNEMRKALGIATSKRSADLGAISIDAPIDVEDPNGDSLKDSIADNDLPPVDEIAIEHDIQIQVREIVSRMKNERQREALEASYFEGRTQEQIAQEMGCSPQYVAMLIAKAKQTLRRSRALADCLRYETPYSKHIGVERFHSTNTSAVEYAVLWREKMIAHFAHEVS